MFNGDLEVSVCKPDQQLEGFYRNGEGDEVLYIHRGGGAAHGLRDGAVPEKDYVVIRAGHAHVRARRRPPAWLCFHTPARSKPNRYRNR